MNGSEHFDPDLVPLPPRQARARSGEDSHAALMAHLHGRGPGSRPTCVSHPSPVEVLVASFGHLHSDPPKADLLVDVRDHLRDPHVEPALRALTGRDRAVVERVLATPGAGALIDALVAATAALLLAARPAGRLVRVAVGCAGGRHRSVVIADAVAARLALAGWGAQAEHLHIGAPVVAR